VDLLLAELGRGLGLVQALERSVVALVEPPALVHGQPEQVHALERDGERADRALQERGVGHVEGVALGAEEPRRLLRFPDALRREVDVRPAREPVLEVPRALAVPQQDQLDHRARSSVRGQL
jgi:hypothetical protein